MMHQLKDVGIKMKLNVQKGYFLVILSLLLMIRYHVQPMNNALLYPFHICGESNFNIILVSNILPIISQISKS